MNILATFHAGTACFFSSGDNTMNPEMALLKVEAAIKNRPTNLTNKHWAIVWQNKDFTLLPKNKWKTKQFFFGIISEDDCRNGLTQSQWFQIKLKIANAGKGFEL